jgi:hypothetical protein
MRTLALFLAFAAYAAASPALEASGATTGGQRVLACGLRMTGEEASTYRHLKCIVGTTVGVSPHAMQVRPAHGPVRRLRFTDETRFETNSGEGALNGLAVRDRVCVAYTGAGQTLTARIVAFNPRSTPCRSGKHSTRSPGDGGGD